MFYGSVVSGGLQTRTAVVPKWRNIASLNSLAICSGFCQDSSCQDHRAKTVTDSQKLKNPTKSQRANVQLYNLNLSETSPHLHTQHKALYPNAAPAECVKSFRVASRYMASGGGTSRMTKRTELVELWTSNAINDSPADDLIIQSSVELFHHVIAYFFYKKNL